MGDSSHSESAGDIHEIPCPTRMANNWQKLQWLAKKRSFTLILRLGADGPEAQSSLDEFGGQTCDFGHPYRV